VTDRCIPLVTAAYGTRVARPGENDEARAYGNGSSWPETEGLPRRPVHRWQPPVGYAAAVGRDSKSPPRSGEKHQPVTNAVDDGRQIGVGDDFLGTDLSRPASAGRAWTSDLGAI
jgi:hypothetical protein